MYLVPHKITTPAYIFKLTRPLNGATEEAGGSPSHTQEEPEQLFPSTFRLRSLQNKVQKSRKKYMWRDVDGDLQPGSIQSYLYLPNLSPERRSGWFSGLAVIYFAILGSPLCLLLREGSGSLIAEQRFLFLRLRPCSPSPQSLGPHVRLRDLVQGGRREHAYSKTSVDFALGARCGRQHVRVPSSSSVSRTRRRELARSPHCGCRRGAWMLSSAATSSGIGLDSYRWWPYCIVTAPGVWVYRRRQL